MYLWHQNVFIFLKNHNIPYSTQNPVMNDRAAMDGLTLICWTVSILAGIIITNYIEKPIVKYGLKNSNFKIIGAYTSKTPSKKHSPLQRVNKVHN